MAVRLASSMISMLCWPTGLLLLSCLISWSWAFNLDLSSAITHHGQAGSMFGFTVLQYSDQGKQMLLIGAPEAQTKQPDVTKGGAVFKCSITQQDVCEEVVFDSKGANTAYNPYTREREAYDQKSHQWFGATLTSSGPDGAVAACAPRYVYFSPNFAKREPVGTCYVGTQSLNSFQERSPCRSGSGSSGYHQQGSCQAGFSAALSRDGERFFIGAPGSWYWQGQLHSTAMKDPEDLLSTNEGLPSIYDDSYLGYSAVAGEFTGDRHDDVAVGMPRGNNLAGEVILYDRNLRNLVNLTGDQMGSYFGYSLAVGDINNDRLDDLIVGAPLYTGTSSSDNSYEKGRVYIFYQKSTHLFSVPDVLDGESNRGRLGMSVAFVGDLNLDHFGDIAVGAPYAGEEGKGIVYIYMGGKNGIVKTATQAIDGKALDFQLSTFGFSLSGGADLDGNQYPDIIVGAYKSDRAVVLKSRPVVVVTALLDMPTSINLEQRTCPLKNGTQVSCFVLGTFISYSGINVPDHLSIEVETILDSGAKTPRAFFRALEGQSRMNNTFELAKNQQRNSSVYVYMPNQFRDKLNPIKIEAKYRILDARVAASRQRRQAVVPVLDQLNSTSVTKQILIGNKCGPTNICHPKLRMSTRESFGMQEYVLGKLDHLTFDVEVRNDGQDSFETMYYLNLPPGISYVKALPQPGSQNFGLSCVQPSADSPVICDVANPLPAGQVAKFKIFLEPIAAQMTLEDLNFTAKLNSSNPELSPDPRGNLVDFRLKVHAEAQLFVTGASFPETVTFCADCLTPATYTEAKQIGEIITHTYTILNRGPSTMETGQVNIVWPSYTSNHMRLLYIMEQPLVEGPAQCEPVPANLANVVILRNETLTSWARDKAAQFRITPTISLPPAQLDTNPAGRQLRQVNQEQVENVDGLVRERRQAPYVDTSRSEWNDPLKACGASDCTYIICNIGRMTEKDSVVISVRSRLWDESLRKLEFSDTSVSSKAFVQVKTLSHGIRPRAHQFASAVVKTGVVASKPTMTMAGLQWWMILIGVLVGLILLVLVILICWKCGYFKRKRPGIAGSAGAGGPITRSPLPPATSNGRGTTNGNSAAPYLAYRYDYADNKYYPERAPGDAYL